jgi:acetyltransferase-like isoleucine patch superfamily enzyme
MESKSKASKILKPDVHREEMSYSLILSFMILLTNYLGSFLVPIVVFMLYFFLYFLPNFLEISNFIIIFTEIEPLMALITMPLVLIGCYLIRLYFIALITRIIWAYTESKSPSKSGIIPRNIKSKTERYYHIRSFLMKYPKNLVVKGLFPWLSNWLYNYVGSMVVGKGTTFEESVGNEKFAIIGKNCYIGVNSTLATHMVEGVWGNIAYFQIQVGDNVTIAGNNQVGAGTMIHSNSYLLPLASATKHSVVKGGHHYYFGIPLRKIFDKKVMNYLDLTRENLEKNKISLGDIEVKKKSNNKYKKIKKKQEKKKVDSNQTRMKEKNNAIHIQEYENIDYNLDFTTSSAISRVNIKFLAVYLPIFWISGLQVAVLFYTYTFFVKNLIMFTFFLPVILFTLYFIFILGCFLYSKLFLILINLIHKPKEGTFLAEIGDTDYEFWMLRTELKKIVLWLMRNSPIPWADVLAFKWFGIKIDFSSYLYDAWCDGEFLYLGRKVVVGQGATLMSSMVVGKYLVISKIFLDDYALIGGHTTIAPGTIVGKDTVVGAISTTTYNQIMEPGFIYIGIPALKLKPNKYAESRRDIIVKKDVDEEIKFDVQHEVNIEEDKREKL